MGYEGSSRFLSGITNNSSILTWNGIDDTLKFDAAFQQLFSGSDGVLLDVDVVLKMNEDLKEKDFKFIDKISVPYGSCKLYEGPAIRSLYFKIEEEEIAEYIVFVSDSSVALTFQARLMSFKVGILN